MFCVGTGLCDQLIARPEEFYRVFTFVCVCVCVCLIACDLSTSKKKEAAYGPVGEFANKKNNLLWKVGLLSAETLKIDICSIINASSMT